MQINVTSGTVTIKLAKNEQRCLQKARDICETLLVYDESLAPICDGLDKAISRVGPTGLYEAGPLLDGPDKDDPGAGGAV